MKMRMENKKITYFGGRIAVTLHSHEFCILAYRRLTMRDLSIFECWFWGREGRGISALQTPREDCNWWLTARTQVGRS